MSEQPRFLWDARIARVIVRPLVQTPITPNHLTTLRGAVGLTAAWGFSGMAPYGTVTAGTLFFLSTFLDHADGELARLTDQSSQFGYYYDLISDGLVNAVAFLAIGWGLPGEALHGLGPWLGLVAGICVSVMITMTLYFEQYQGSIRPHLPSMWGFELEDSLYIVVLAAWLGALREILILATVGCPLATILIGWNVVLPLFSGGREQ